MTVSTPDISSLLAPTRVHRGVASRAEVLAPFQYYSEVGEAIYILDYSSHQSIAKVYLHFDSSGALLARMPVLDSHSLEPDISNSAHFSVSELQQMECIETNFYDCLAEMHLASSQMTVPYLDVAELDQLKNLSEVPPIVIGGCGRSGTTLLLSVLGAHPAILAFPEELYAFYPKPFRLRRVLNAVHEYGKQQAWRRWCEKTPKNVRAFGDILSAFGDEIRLIHIVRDGRDVITSHHPNDSSRYYIPPERWVADVQAGLTYADQTCLVRYEELVREPEATLERICNYLNEELDLKMLAFEENTTVRENKAWEGRSIKPLRNDSIERWRMPENAERVQEFLNYPGAAELLHQLHYE